jgi:hypothetical protein
MLLLLCVGARRVAKEHRLPVEYMAAIERSMTLNHFCCNYHRRSVSFGGGDSGKESKS